mmetsp:Transcript_6616/g.8474  ORF Transcript_6616/g.8474 Transcript_6616/m.8474 type:complete len:83 (-) Transcript_6616:347-595(-)
MPKPEPKQITWRRHWKLAKKINQYMGKAEKLRRAGREIAQEYYKLKGSAKLPIPTLPPEVYPYSATAGPELYRLPRTVDELD